MPLAQKILKRATDEHVDFTYVVLDLCRRQLGEDDSFENSRTAALYSRAAFLAVSELLALAKKENVDTVRRSLLAMASRRDDQGLTRPGQGPG